jgi:hypothetical protein
MQENQEQQIWFNVIVTTAWREQGSSAAGATAQSFSGIRFRKSRHAH